ncbi:MAG TPA: hypothetical protein VK676_00995 [Steroidobacteraceae bacterium]|jgi:hypothetical protein|nr:hypothetical protein [Steroidobacteraceae bacterium]
MSADTTQALGWVATCVFVASYFFSQASSLRAMQMAGAAIWIAYGVLINARPVIAANALVLTAAAWTAARAQFTAPPSGQRD